MYVLPSTWKPGKERGVLVCSLYKWTLWLHSTTQYPECSLAIQTSITALLPLGAAHCHWTTCSWVTPSLLLSLWVSDETFESHRNNASCHASGLRKLEKGIIWMLQIEYQVVFICVPRIIVPKHTEMKSSVYLSCQNGNSHRA